VNAIVNPLIFAFYWDVSQREYFDFFRLRVKRIVDSLQLQGL